MTKGIVKLEAAFENVADFEDFKDALYAAIVSVEGVFEVGFAEENEES